MIFYGVKTKLFRKKMSVIMEEQEQENKRKRARSENWVEEDKVLLKELVKERVGVLENKNTDTITNKKKLAGWADLQNSFNFMCYGAKRTLTQLKNQWGHMKVEAKKTKSDQTQKTQTGGVPPPALKPENGDELEAWRPQEFVDDFNEYDSDQSNQTPHVKKDIDTETNDPLLVIIQEGETAAAEQVVESAEEPTPVKKRKKNNIMTAEEQIVAVEIKCRKELHEAQMRNEKIKNDNLIREQQILQIKAAYYKRKLESFDKTLY